jgi:uncharacterized membrane protein YjjP (DUF1212 family)
MLRATIPGYFSIGREPEESEIAESAFLCLTFAPVFVGFFLHCLGQFSGSLCNIYTRQIMISRVGMEQRA